MRRLYMREHTCFVDNRDYLLVETLRATSPIIPSINHRDVARYVSTDRGDQHIGESAYFVWQQCHISFSKIG